MAEDLVGLEREIRHFVRENFIVGETDLASDASLTQTGIIDSLGVLELVMFLEQRYGVRVSEAETLPENLDSVRNLVRYVTGKLGQPWETHDHETAQA